MRLVRSTRAMETWSRALQREGLVIGLVPTMGALHEGHRALIRRARLSCDAVVVSLFVNPRQFGAGEDLARYPRRLRQDAALCRDAGADVLFAPSVAAIYPAGYQTSVSVPSLARRWEGAARPRHFEGVATVITKLFSLIRPERAFFGRKDFQQAAIVRRLAADLNLGVRIVVCPTVREADGLALSSRNGYLTPEQRRAAPVLYRALRAGEAAIRGGTTSAARVRAAMRRIVAGEPLAREEYLAVCDAQTLEPLRRVRGRVVLLGAVRLGGVRLIDNLLVSGRSAGASAQAGLSR